MTDLKYNKNGVRLPRQSKRVSRSFADVDRVTLQADKERANIHNILAQATRTGILPTKQAVPFDGVLPDVDSFHAAMNIVVAGQRSFEALPSAIREKFGHSPAAMLSFISNPDNREACIELGLMEKPFEQGPVRVVVEPPSSAPQNAGAEGGSAS